MTVSVKTKLFTLDNGLRVAIYPAPQYQTVGVAVGVRYGSIDEDPRVSGAAHYLEHMLFKGTRKRTWQEINDIPRNLGMMRNAFTDKETTTYFLGAYKGYLNKAIDLLSDQIMNSTFPKKEFELERGPIINENLINDDSPIYMFYDFLPKVLYKKHPARLPTGGDEASIRRTDLQDVLKIYDRYYSPQNMLVTIYGGVSTEKALATVKKHFSGFERKYNAQKRIQAKEKQVKSEITVLKKGIKQTRIGIGFKTKGFAEAHTKEYLTVSLISEILSRRLFDEVREKRGLSYDPRASYSAYGTFGFMAAAAGVEPKNLQRAKETILKEFGKLQDGEVDRDEVKNRKTGLSIRFLTGREDTLGMALSISESYLLYNSIALAEKMPELIREVSLDDVRKYCAKYIDVDRYGLVILKPKE
ncbi:MAG: insulinase family protein [Candidatus Micrarchaeota archaeon]|nr:insulinase family protein [Candidatus Micrarchaeota archaeon]